MDFLLISCPSKLDGESPLPQSVGSTGGYDRNLTVTERLRGLMRGNDRHPMNVRSHIKDSDQLHASGVPPLA